MGGTHWYGCSQGNLMIVVKQRSMSSNYCRGPGKFNFKYIQYRYHYVVSPSVSGRHREIKFMSPGLGREQTVAAIASVRGPEAGLGKNESLVTGPGAGVCADGRGARAP